MRALSPLLACLLIVGASGVASAAKGPPKLKVLGPMQVELGDELSDDAWKAFKVADRCANADKTWLRAMEPEQQNGIDTLVEMMAAPVTCWQGAEKKVGKVGEEVAALGRYVTAQKHYVETMRAYLFALQAKLLGDQLNACKRFKIAIAESAEASTSSVDLMDSFTSVESKTLAAQLTENSKGVAGMIGDVYASLNCD